MRFINRKGELTALEKFWTKKDAQLLVIYGKRRIGKTELIKQFTKRKPHVYYLAQRINDHENLRLLGETVGEFFGDDILMKKGFDNWQWFFEYLGKHVKKKTVIAIDEFPYLAEANKGISSIFQSGWDQYLQHNPVYLILCGSSIAMMEEEVLAYKAPLYGRRTGQIFLKPLTFQNTRLFSPVLPFERALEFYAIAGGNPTYLKRLNPKLTTNQNILQNILQPEAFLYNEIEFILREELREPRNYFAILKAIALSKNKVSEIVNETGLEKGILHKYLFILEDLHIIKKEVPVTERNPLKSRRGIYKLHDQFFRFWFKYILPNKGAIEEARTGYVFKKIKNDFNLIVAENYEQVAMELIKAHEKIFFPIAKIGRWWYRNEEIDIVAVDEEGHRILFGEVKWSNKPVGVNIYKDLKRKACLVDVSDKKQKKYFCLFSKKGYTKDMLVLAEKEKIALFERDKLIRI